MLFLYLPIVALIVLSFNESKSMSVWGGFSLRWYQELFRSRIMMGAIANTFSIAILAALIATVVGTFAVLGMAAMRPRTQNVLLGLNNIPMLNADIVTGIALMLFFLMVGAPRGYMTILFSHATFCIPYVILSVRPRVNKNTDRLFEAALDLGASERYAFRKIVLPELRPGIMSGFLLSFTMSVDDFIISYFVAQLFVKAYGDKPGVEVDIGVARFPYPLFGFFNYFCAEILSAVFGKNYHASYHNAAAVKLIESACRKGISVLGEDYVFALSSVMLVKFFSERNVIFSVHSLDAHIISTGLLPFLRCSDNFDFCHNNHSFLGFQRALSSAMTVLYQAKPDKKGTKTGSL